MPLAPFTIDVPDAALSDLRERLARTRWPDEVGGAGWDYGTPLGYLRELVEHWRTRFDWRSVERRMNALPQFRATVDGLDLHFVHQRGRGPRPLPLLLLHGWPSTFWQMGRLVPLLVDPASHGGDAADAFDVVVPSLPGCGFSARPDRPGMTRARIADLMARLMTGSLGYRRYGVHAGDVGTSVATLLGLARPDDVVGLQLTDVYFAPWLGPGAPPLTPAEERFVAEQERWWQDEGGYDHLQRTKPQTLAYALNDSPAGLAAWIVEKFRAWSDCGGDLDRSFRRDDLLTAITLYWVTGTINSANRYYWRHRHPAVPPRPALPIAVPCGIAHFPAEADINTPRSMIERVYTNVTRWSEMPRGGHFAALETPDLLAEEIRAFFRPLRR